MTESIKFILNDCEINTTVSPTSVLVDFIREHQGLKGTTVACREGDCGACTTLIGELRDDDLVYRSVTSCIFPLGNVAGKHVVTVEGLNPCEGPGQRSLNPLQQALLDSCGTQCGFCTPGFVVSLAGLFLKQQSFSLEQGISEIDGNICRCTGYKSIERAVESLRQKFGQDQAGGRDKIQSLVLCEILPKYFLEIKDKLSSLSAVITDSSHAASSVVGGGTDLYVQIPEKMQERQVHFTLLDESLRGICIENERCTIGASTSIEEIRTSTPLEKYLPGLQGYFKLFGSTPIRQQATLGGNIVNASPIGDCTIFFLALDAEVSLRSGSQLRKVALKDFYLDYKKLDKQEREIVASLSFQLPSDGSRFNFEKVSRRTYLDIASVNSAFHVRMNGAQIDDAALSAGGVAAVPLFLKQTSEFLCGREVSVDTIQGAVKVAQQEVSPITDVRGTAEYKRLLLRQLLYAHFLRSFSDKVNLQDLV